MSIADYKESIKKLVDSTNNEDLLKGWKTQLEHDLEADNEFEFDEEEWRLVQEGLDEYARGETISFEEFINKRK